jgi:hypothetical protein
MRALTPETAEASGVQVLTIGNAYESAVRAPEPIAKMEPLFLADEAHLSQKAAYWLTPLGFPSAAVCRMPVLASSGPTPTSHYVCPPRKTSSISADLLADDATRDVLLHLLDRKSPVLVSPYAWSREACAVRDWLTEFGYDVLTPAVDLDQLAKLNSKVATQLSFFGARPDLATLRPHCSIAGDLNGLDDAVRRVARASGGEQVVVKSSIGVGGDGVFFVDANAVDRGEPAASMMFATGYNGRNITPPFLVEAFIPGIAFPTVDLVVRPTGVDWLCGAYEQRLFDKRYFAGFHMLDQHASRSVPWFPRLLEAAETVGNALAEESYEGYINVDFVVTADGIPFVVELNPRRSALLDGIGLAHHVLGDGFGCNISCADYIEARGTSSQADAAARLQRVTDAAGGGVRIALDAGYESDYAWLSLVALTSADAERLLASGIDAVGGLPPDTSLADEVGVASSWTSAG